MFETADLCWALNTDSDQRGLSKSGKTSITLIQIASKEAGYNEGCGGKLVSIFRTGNGINSLKLSINNEKSSGPN